MHAPLMDDGTRHDIAGVVIAVIGVALLIAVLTPTSGVLTQAVSDGLHALLGVGAFLLPVGLLLWALTFFVHITHIEPGRVAVGLGLVALAVMGLVGIAAPNAEADPSLLFNAFVLADRGGYVGNGLAWLLITLTGRTVGVIVLLGIAVAGLLVVGFSATGAVQSLVARSQQRKAYARARSEERAAALAREQHMAWVQRNGVQMPNDYAPTALFDPDRPLSGSVPETPARTTAIPANQGVVTDLFDACGRPVSLVYGQAPSMPTAAPGYAVDPSRAGSVVRRPDEHETVPVSHTYGCGVAPYGGEAPDAGAADRVPSAAPATASPRPTAAETTYITLDMEEREGEEVLPPVIPAVDPAVAFAPMAEPPADRQDPRRGKPSGRRSVRNSQWWDPADDWSRDDFDPEEYALRTVSTLVPGVLPGAPVDLDDAASDEGFDEIGDPMPALQGSSVVTASPSAPDAADDGEPVVFYAKGAAKTDDVAQRVSALTRAAVEANAGAPSSCSPRPAKKAEEAVAAADVSVELPWDPPAQVVPQAAATGEGGSFTLPSPSIFKRGDAMEALSAEEQGEAAETASRLQATLVEFGVEAEVKGWVEGPTCTTYRVSPGAGVRVNKFTALEDDIARILARESVRIYAPVPGTSYVGIEVSRAKRRSVNFGDLLAHLDGGPLDIAVGLDTSGKPVHADLAKLPHLLIAGTTGSGKSVCVNAMIVSMLMRNTPEDVRLILVDPKQVEFVGYNGIPHLVMPVVTDMRQAAAALQWGVTEMDRRYRLFSTLGVRDLKGYNALADSGAFDNGESPLQHLPSVVIVIDELADLMMVAKKDVEASIVRIAQLGRAAGVHLIIATQSPRADTVTGLIRANIAARVALRVSKGTESRIILDETGAEKLLPHGDMLFLDPGWGDKPRRIQGCYVSDPEISRVVEHLKAQPAVQYNGAMAPLPGTQLTVSFSDDGTASPGIGSPVVSGDAGGDDPLAWEAAQLVVENQLGSTSMIQRRLKLGYARAGRVMDMLEEMGVVGPAQGSKPRDVLVRDLEELATLRGNGFEGSEEDY